MSMSHSSNTLDTIVRGVIYADEVVTTSSGYLPHAAGEYWIFSFHFQPLFLVISHPVTFLLGYNNIFSTILTRIAVFIFFDKNYYAKLASVEDIFHLDKKQPSIEKIFRLIHF